MTLATSAVLVLTILIAPSFESSDGSELTFNGRWQTGSRNAPSTFIVDGEDFPEAGSRSADDEPANPGNSGGDPSTVIPAGAGPVGEQMAWPDYRNDLRECPAGTTRTSAEFSCWDVVNREAYWVWPLPGDEADGDESDEEAAEGEVVTGAQLATAVREHARVRIAPAPLVIQPDQQWHLVNLPVIVRTEPAGQDFSAQLLGLPVEIRAEPVSYSWDFGDGSPVVNTTDAGAEYPDQTIEHAYSEAGEYQITLITYWSGAFRVAGGPWIGIDGLGVTATTSPVLDLQNRTTSLVG